MAVMMINMSAVYIICGVYSECSVPKMKGGWMTRVTPVNTGQRVIISKMPQASLRKMQERRVIMAGLMEEIIITSPIGRCLAAEVRGGLMLYILPYCVEIPGEKYSD